MWVLGGSLLLLSADVKPFVLKLLKRHYINDKSYVHSYKVLFYNKYITNSGHMKIRIITHIKYLNKLGLLLLSSYLLLVLRYLQVPATCLLLYLSVFCCPYAF